MMSTFSLQAARVAGIVGSLACAGAASAQLAAPYTQNFNSLGTTGTSLSGAGISEWSVYRLAGGAGTFTAATGIPAASVGGGTLVDDTSTVQSAQAPLGIFYNPSFPAFTRFGGVNAGLSANANETNRSLGTSPTGVAAHALQLTLTNDTALPLPAIALSYTMTVLTVGLDEQPGYRFFYSTGGVNGTWNSVAALDAVSSESDVAFTSYTRASVFTLDNALAPGAQVLFRWVDDNGVAGSPDQMISIDNVVVVPAPGALGVLALGAVGARLRRR
ncbi:hypothetical protein BH11PLA1_BH11PLA1_06140 [soil metagenome]